MTFQILTLSGGGYMGLYTAAVLAEIEKQSGRQMFEMFDLFAGTSIGGIIALGLAAGKPAAEIRDAFVEDGKKIFGASAPARGLSKVLDIAASTISPRYGPYALKATIHRIVGVDTRMADLRRPTVVTAVNLTKGGPKVFKTGHHSRLVLDWRLSVTDVALATSAAPTYFPVHAIGNELFADGGVFANSPDLIAMHEAELFLEIPRNDIHVLSVGTTTTRFAMSHGVTEEMGIWQWVKDERLTNVIIGCQQALTDDMMRHQLGDRYVRVDRIQADSQRDELALDCASATATADLLAMASSSVAELSNNSYFRSMLKRTATDRPFINASL